MAIKKRLHPLHLKDLLPIQDPLLRIDMIVDHSINNPRSRRVMLSLIQDHMASNHLHKEDIPSTRNPRVNMPLSLEVILLLIHVPVVDGFL
jgi:hypothetical protein